MSTWKVSRDHFFGFPLIPFVRASFSYFTALIFWRSPLFFPCFCNCPLVWRFFGLLLFSLFPVLRYSPNFFDEMPRECKECPRKSFSCALLLSSRDEEGLVGFSPLLCERLTSLKVFPHILQVKRD